jgi:hypothetical protein
MVPFASAAATPAGNAGSKYFAQAARSLRDGKADDAATAAEKGVYSRRLSHPDSEYVKAEDIPRTSLAAENRGAQKSSLYVAFLQSVAFLRERQGDLNDAEALYRSTIVYSAPDLSVVAVIPTPRSGKHSFPFIGDPRLGLAIFYSNHDPAGEAEGLYRE